MKRKLALCFLFIVLTGFLYLIVSHFARGFHSSDTLNNRDFSIAREANVFRAVVEGETLKVIPIESSQGYLHWISGEESDVVSIFAENLLDLEECSLIRTDSSSYLNKTELISFLSNYSPENTMLQCKKKETVDDRGLVHRSIEVSGDYTGELVCYVNHGSHTCNIPIAYTDLKSNLNSKATSKTISLILSGVIAMIITIFGFLVTSRVSTNYRKKKTVEK